MRFAPATEGPTLPLSPLPPARWPIDFVLVANEAGRAQWLDIHKLQTVFTPALRQLCAVPDHHIELFPDPGPPRPPLTPIPTPRPDLLHSLTTSPTHYSSQTDIPPRHPSPTTPNYANWPDNPTLLDCQPYDAAPHRPLHLVEICAGIATGLEAFLRAGHHIASCTWADINPDAHIATSHRLQLLQRRFPEHSHPLPSWVGTNDSHLTPIALSPQCWASSRQALT